MLFARHASWRHTESRILLSTLGQCDMRATLRRYHAALYQRIANLISSPLPPVLGPSAHCKASTPRNSSLQKPSAFWSSNVAKDPCRRSKLCSSCTPAMSARAKIEEGCSIGGWHTICYPGSKQSSRRCSQISKGSTMDLRSRPQKQYLGHFGAFIASRGKSR